MEPKGLKKAQNRPFGGGGGAEWQMCWIRIVKTTLQPANTSVLERFR